MKGKHKYGQYFTENVIAEYMVSLIKHPLDSQILEPSCGKGVFLSELEKSGFPNSHGYEIDDQLATEFENVQHKSFLSVPTDEKYDVVIGNPPYIRWKNLEDELKSELVTLPLWNRYFNSLCDYLFIFILKSIEHLTDGGELILICSDYWMNTTNSMSLRNYMVNHGYFERIYHFKEAPLFEKVNASFIIFRYIKSAKKSTQPIRLFTYTQKGKPTKEELLTGSCFNEERIPQFEQNQRWLLATEELQKELDWFESICVKHENLFEKELSRIGDVCDIGNGMVSGLDSAFKLPKDSISNLNHAEKENTINVLKAKNLEQYCYTDSAKYIYIPQGTPVADFATEYPNFEEQLRPYLNELQKRYNYGRDIPYWEFAFPRSKSLFEKPVAKIFVPCKERISHKSYFRFCYAPEGYYPLQDVTAIVRKHNCRESIEYMLAYLNSDYVYDWLRYNGIVKGEIVEFSEAPIASIPFLRIDWGNETEVNLHNAITDAIKILINDKQNNQKNKIKDLLKTLFNERN